MLQPGAIAPACVCYHGFAGVSCDQCTPNFVGTQCERCRDDYIGYNTTCDTFCANGYATHYGIEVFTCISFVFFFITLKIFFIKFQLVTTELVSEQSNFENKTKCNKMYFKFNVLYF